MINNNNRQNDDEVKVVMRYIKGATIKQNGLYGFSSHKGDIIVPIQYDEVHGFDNGISVRKNNYCGFYSYSGEIIVPVIYDYLLVNHAGIKVMKDGKYGVYSFDGKLVVPVENFMVQFRQFFNLVDVKKDKFSSWKTIRID